MITKETTTTTNPTTTSTVLIFQSKRQKAYNRELIASHLHAAFKLKFPAIVARAACGQFLYINQNFPFCLVNLRTEVIGAENSLTGDEHFCKKCCIVLQRVQELLE